MGLFANIRKNKSGFDDSDDWLLDLQGLDDPAEFDLASPEPGAPTAPDTALMPVPPPGMPEVTAWHLPDLGPTESPVPAFQEPQAPPCEPTALGGAEPLWSPPGNEAEFSWDAVSWMPEPAPHVPAPQVGDAPDGGPGSAEAAVMLEILGLFPGASWADVRDAHRELIEGHRVDAFTDIAHAHLAEEIRREMNTAYAALRLMAACR